MREKMRKDKLTLQILLTLTLCNPLAASAQEPVVAEFSLARQHALHPTVKLSGTVKARHRAVIGSESEGIVIALHVREGDAVKKGDSLAQFRTDILEQRHMAAGSALDAVLARQELTRRKLKRARELFSNQSMSQQQLDELDFELLELQAEEQRLKAQIAQTALYIDHSHVRAPFDGVIIARHTDIGEWREAGAPIVELISVADLEVEVSVPEIYFDDLQGVESAEVAFTALSTKRYSLELAALVPAAASGSRNMSARLDIPATLLELAIADGMSVEVWLAIGQSNTATIVPKDAIVQRQEERLVLVLDEDDQVRMVAVVPGKSSGTWIQVRGEVREGDRVIVRGNERLWAGQKVIATQLNYPEP
jgi:RND family efflux transporter MFP subunit